MPSPTASPDMRPSRGLVVLLAVAAGAAVGNLYWAQPLLEVIGHELDVPSGHTGWLVTATQLGYAVGILLLVPLGDVLDRRRLVPVLLTASAVMLVGCALAPTFPVLLAAVTLVGLTTVSGQVIAPLAGDLADPAERGRVVGTVTSGILTGILLSRTVSGLVAGAFGWRTIYAAAAVLALVLAVVTWRRLPVLPPKTHLPYPALIRSVFTVIARERVVRWSLVLGALQFGLFTMFWTALTFLLSAPPYGYSEAAIGLFGLFGLAGAVAAQRSGRLHDRGWSLPATGVGWVAVLVSFVTAALTGRHIVGVVVAIVLLDIAIQSLNILNQTRLFAVSHEERSRLNTAAITTNFLAGAVGSALTGPLWQAGGWLAVSTAGAVLSLVGLGVWAVGRRGALVRT